jgi:hypothetical protein
MLVLLSGAGVLSRSDDAVVVQRTTRPAAAPAAAVPAQRRQVHTTLEDRVAVYTKALNLDPTQQSQLRTLLILQREQVQRLWNDTSMDPANRVYATRTISDATADRIRAMLTEEQRRKYNPPRPPRNPAPAESARSVEDWMQAANPK